MHNKKYLGFTLAEVLITLAIIGVVAATVIPGIITNARNKDMAVAEQKARSTFSNAFMKASMDNGGSLDGVNLGKEIGNYVKVQENCNLTGSYNCWHPNGAKMKQKDGSVASWAARTKSSVLTQDGMFIRLGSSTLTCNKGHVEPKPTDCYNYTYQAGYCGATYIDVNGNREPNTYGQDIREVYIWGNGFVSFPGDKRNNTRWTRTKNQPDAAYVKDNTEEVSCYDTNSYTVTLYN